MDISIVIPVLNEQECITALLQEIADHTAGLPVKDIMVVDDGSTDDTAAIVASCAKDIPQIRLVRHKVRRGQSTALRTGIQQAKGTLIVTLDGDGQNNPADIPLLFESYQKIAAQSPKTLVAGQRKKRHDNFIRRLSSRVANFVRSNMLDDGVRDTGCSLKLFRREDFLALPFFNHIHRFIPALMKAYGADIILIDVSHRPREHGVSKYGLWDRLWVGIADLFGVRWLVSRLEKEAEVVDK